MQAILFLAFAALVLAKPADAYAQADSQADTSSQQSMSAAASEGAQAYPRQFFDRFNPQTALDIVERLPGFTFAADDDDLRGFGAAAGNVLIDGERPSSKAGGIEDALKRIPASRVESVELIRGSAGLTEAAGQAVVANVIRKRGGTAGSWELQIERNGNGRVYPRAELTIAKRLGAWDNSTKINGFWEEFPRIGPRIQRDADGTLRSSQAEDVSSVLTQGYLSTDADRTLAGGTLTITARAGRSLFIPDTERLGFDARLPDNAPDERFFIDFDSYITEGELGIDWTRTLESDWSLKLLSFLAFENRDDDQVVTTERPIGSLASSSRFRSTADRQETVLRGTLGFAGESVFRPEFGAEIALNRFDSELSLATTAGGVTTAIDLPAADVNVEEARVEAFANLIWRTTQSLSVETGFAVEASEISVSGDAQSTQRFTFLKPFATLIYDARPGLQLRLGARRTVGQLDFTQFAASAEADDDRLLGGNPELGPDQTTRASFTVDLRSEKRGALNLEFFHEWREDVIEQVLLPSGALGAANAGRGRVWGLTTNVAMPLTRLIPGGLIELEADIRDSSFDDPLSGDDRDLSEIASPTVLAEFRQDLTKWRVAWGFSYRAAQDTPTFFANEESFFEFGRQWTAFIETTRFLGLRTNLSVRNIGDRTSFRERRFFEPSRAGQFVGSETIDLDRGTFVTLTLTGQF